MVPCLRATSTVGRRLGRIGAPSSAPPVSNSRRLATICAPPSWFVACACHRWRGPSSPRRSAPPSSPLSPSPIAEGGRGSAPTRTRYQLHRHGRLPRSPSTPSSPRRRLRAQAKPSMELWRHISTAESPSAINALLHPLPFLHRPQQPLPTYDYKWGGLQLIPHISPPRRRFNH